MNRDELVGLANTNEPGVDPLDYAVKVIASLERQLDSAESSRHDLEKKMIEIQANYIRVLERKIKEI